MSLLLGRQGAHHRDVTQPCLGEGVRKSLMRTSIDENMGSRQQFVELSEGLMPDISTSC